MSGTNKTQTYRRTQVLTAGPERLQLMLYDGALRFLDQGRLALAARDREGACVALERARRIVLYLSECLRPGVAPELCALVGSAYGFIYGRLVDAALRGSVDSLDEAVGVLTELREAWADLLRLRAEPPVPDETHPVSRKRVVLTG